MRRGRERRRLARTRPPTPPKPVADALVFARKYAAEIAAEAEAEGLDPDSVPAEWSGVEHACPCCVERQAEFDADRFWQQYVPLAPCTTHEDCKAVEDIGWACAADQITRHTKEHRP